MEQFVKQADAPVMERVTTEYSDSEDRLRLTGQIAGGSHLAIWLTQRLVWRLLPPLFEWLAQQGQPSAAPALLHSFAQQAAKAQLSPQQPVILAEHGQVWLVQSIDVRRSQQQLQLVFRGADGASAMLPFQVLQLRQWLSILYEACTKADWPEAPWPEWLRAQPPAAPNSAVLH